MSHIPLAPEPTLGSGEVENRYAPRVVVARDYGFLPEPKPLPWYYNQVLTAFVAISAIVALLMLL